MSVSHITLALFGPIPFSLAYAWWLYVKQSPLGRFKGYESAFRFKSERLRKIRARGTISHREIQAAYKAQLAIVEAEIDKRGLSEIIDA